MVIAERRPPRAILSIDELSSWSFTALLDLYRQGTVPSLRALDGTPSGRVLAANGPLGEGLLRGLCRAATGHPAFPWRGKSFASLDDRRGRGTNQVHAGLDAEVLRFETGIGPSVVDGGPCVALDYDLPGNPWPMRRVRDELREVAPGLFLGPACLPGDERARLLFFFAITKR